MAHYDVIKTVKFFKQKYKNRLADNTVNTYAAYLKMLLEDRCDDSSRSKYIIVKSVIAKAEAIGINIDFKQLPFKKRGGKSAIDNIKRKYMYDSDIQKLVDTINASRMRKKNKTETLAAIKLAITSGMRLSEVLQVRDDNIIRKKEHCVIFIRGKGDKGRRIFLPKDYNLGVDYFTISDNVLKVTINRMMKRAGINSSFHGLRHSFLTNLWMKTKDIALLQEVAGHSDPKTTMVYIDMDTEDEAEKAMRVLSNNTKSIP